MIQTGGHAEGRTFNLVWEVELIPLLPVYTRSSNASLFSLSPRSSISSIYLPPPHTLSQLSQHPHTPFMSPVWGCVCVCKYVYSAPILCPRRVTHVRLNSESVSPVLSYLLFCPQNADVILKQCAKSSSFLVIKKKELIFLFLSHYLTLVWLHIDSGTSLQRYQISIVI